MKDNKAFKPQIEVQLPKIKDMIPEKEENVYLIYETLGYIPVYENEYELEAGILTIKPKDITNSYKCKIVAIYPEGIYSEENIDLSYKTTIKVDEKGIKTTEHKEIIVIDEISKEITSTYIN